MTTKQRPITTTGGRDATTRHIPGDFALAVGMPRTDAPAGWAWTPLTDIARLESGHTPSRKHPEYWSGEIPWICLTDARPNHGKVIEDTEEHTNDLGIANSSARVLPKDTVCLSRTASVGYVVVMGREMATSQDFVNWVCSKNLDHQFLKYLLIAESGAFRRFSSGSVHQTIYFPEVKAFHICHPPLDEQRRIVGILDEAFEGLATAKATAEQNLQNACALFESHLQAVFTQRGEGWVEKSLVDVCTFINGRAYKKDEMLSVGKYPLLRVGNFFTNRDWYYSDLDLDADKYCDNGDLLYAWSASFGPRVWDGRKVIYHYHIWKVVPHATVVEKRFLLHLLEWDVDEIKKAYGTGTTMMHVSKGSMESRVVPIPPLKEQAAIVSQLDDVREETHRLESIYQRKLTALDELKKSLLHRAFSGQL